MKSKSIRYLITIAMMPLALLMGEAAIAASDNTTKAKRPSEEMANSGEQNKDAFEQASGMERDQPTGPDPTPGEMKQQQPHNSNIEQEVKEAKEKEMQDQKSEETPQTKEEVEKKLQEEGIPPTTSK